MKRVFVLVAFALCGCQNGTPHSLAPLERAQVIRLTRAQIVTVQASVRKNLKDPESARFGTILAGRDSKGNVPVCGMVNAKNSFGGYTGEKPFAGAMVKHGTEFVVVAMGGTDSETYAVQAICEQQGLSL